MQAMEIIRKCEHTFPLRDNKRIRACDKPAEFEVIGRVARFGVPLSEFYCLEHVNTDSRPKMMDYNRFEMKIKDLNTGQIYTKAGFEGMQFATKSLKKYEGKNGVKNG